MKKSFLLDLGIDESAADAVLERSGDELRASLEELEGLRAEREREQSDFSDKLRSAQRDFRILRRLDRERFSSKLAYEGVLERLRISDSEFTDDAALDAELDAIRARDADAFLDAPAPAVELVIPQAGAMTEQHIGALRAALGLVDS